VLLTRAMHVLLTVAFDGELPASCAYLTPAASLAAMPEMPASGDGASTSATPQGGAVRPKVHALNTMKLLFQDASIVRSMERYLAAALQAAVLGFRSPVWAVRNSSMMVFAAVLMRSVGTCCHCVGSCGC
jgi:hypothetical protein